MNRLIRAHDRFLSGLAGLAGSILAAIVVFVAIDVVLRNIGFQPPPHTLALSEYGLYYATLFAAPWLVRSRGHVSVEIVTAAVPAGIRRIMMAIACLSCGLACLIVAWFGWEVTASNYVRGTFDVRSFDMPKWLLFAAMPLSFLLMAVEFARLLFRPQTAPTNARHQPDPL